MDQSREAHLAAWPLHSPEGAWVPETGPSSCCAFVFVDQAAEDIAAVDLSGGWRFRYALAR
jgi:hypothetical protein